MRGINSVNNKKILNVKISSEIHKKLKIKAAEEGTTLKELTAKAILEYCQRDQKLNQKRIEE